MPENISVDIQTTGFRYWFKKVLNKILVKTKTKQEEP